MIPGEMWVTLIAEVEPDGLTGGNIVWQWHIWDHLIQEADPTKENYGVVADHPELLDINYGGVANFSWIHANAIDYNPELDQIVFSSRKMNEIFVIDHSTTTEEAAGHEGGNSGHGGDLLYRWGNPQVYGRGTEEDQNFWGVHGAIWIDAGLPGAGNILTFNNGNRPGTINDYSSVEEIAPPMDTEGNYIIEPGEPYGPATPTWYYDDRPVFYSESIGGAYRMPNGNTLICEGRSRYIFEVTQLGGTVWNYLAPANVHRAPRYWATPAGVGDSIARTANLLDNYPNPFNPSTEIEYRLSQPTEVTIDIYSVEGKRIRNLVHDVLPAGRHQTRWDGKDSVGKAVASGVYFVRLLTETAEQTQKVMLAR
jgi:hypothetical protein